MRLLSRWAGMGILIFSGLVSANEECVSPETQAEMTQCSAKTYQAADDALNEAYQALIGRLENNALSLEKLRVAQRKWIDFRDAECAFESSAVEGGSAQPMVRNGCLEALTKARTQSLQEHASCEEGDLSCVR
ncbi:lysozyme inhibitor LprI family protein [Halomonas hibernica]|uniref:lysozyme inhibitor LprI family protein n=1 Tax=Halomonas hibernica TaxID=2591147 RepID=UPI0015538F4C|nr:lysozyme inhibitor LprI family protein [Halomonas hibernica]